MIKFQKVIQLKVLITDKIIKMKIKIEKKKYLWNKKFKNSNSQFHQIVYRIVAKVSVQ